MEFIREGLGLGEATVYRILAAEKAEKACRLSLLHFDQIDDRFFFYVVTTKTSVAP